MNTNEETVFVLFTSLDSHNLTFSPSSFPPESIIEDIYCIKKPMPPLPVTNTQITRISECSLWSNAKLHVWVKIYAWWYPHIPRSKQITFTHSVSQLVYWPYFSTFTITMYDCKPANTLLFLELHWLCNIAIHKNASKCRFHMLTIMQVKNWCSRNVDMVIFPPLLPHNFKINVYFFK